MNGLNDCVVSTTSETQNSVNANAARGTVMRRVKSQVCGQSQATAAAAVSDAR